MMTKKILFSLTLIVSTLGVTMPIMAVPSNPRGCRNMPRALIYEKGKAAATMYGGDYDTIAEFLADFPATKFGDANTDKEKQCYEMGAKKGLRDRWGIQSQALRNFII